MSIENDLTTPVYQCVFSCDKKQKPTIPFIFPTGENPSPHRYILTSPLENNSLTPFFIHGDRHYYALEVEDTQPAQKSILDDNLDQVESFERDSLKQAGIPDLAFTYLTLTEYNPTIPELLDGWEDSDQEFIIISQNQNYQTLAEYLNTNSLEMTKVLAYLQKMAKLWKSFSKIECCETLLRVDNLKVSGDGTLILDKIYLDRVNDPPLLRQLVEVWAYLLEELTGDYNTMITDLMIKIESGEIDDIKELRSELQSILQEIEMKLILAQENQEEEFILISDSDELQNLVNQFDDEELESEEATQINNSDRDDQPTVVLPMRLLSVTEAGLSDIGRKRSHNEDSFALETFFHKKESSQGSYFSGKGLFILCDGMGGHASGEIASSMAVKNIYRYFQQYWTDKIPDAEVIKEGILQANQAIYSANIQKGQTGSGRMGTTLVMIFLQDTKIAIAHVGDSRIYKVTRKWGLEQLTIDHSVAQSDIKQGIESDVAYARPDAYQLTQALGPRENNFVHPDINYFEVKEDTLFLMCSDGLSDNDLLENHWESALLPLISSKANLDTAINEVIELGNQVNGHDNITCILIRIKVQPNLEHQNPIF